MSLGKIAMTKEALWTWIRSKVNNHESRITDLEGGGSPPGGAITLTGDITGPSDANQISSIKTSTLESVPTAKGELLVFDAATSVIRKQLISKDYYGFLPITNPDADTGFTSGPSPFNIIQYMLGTGDIQDYTQLVIFGIDTAGAGTFDLTLPTLRQTMQLVCVKVLGVSSTGVVNINTTEPKGFDPTPLSAAVSTIPGLGKGTVIWLAGDPFIGCWYNLGINHV